MSPARLLAGIALLLFAAGCSEEKGEAAADQVRPVLSTLAEPVSGRTLGFAGTVEPRYSANLAFRILGRIVSRDVAVGDLVARGATIATLDSVALQLAVQAARADLSNAEAQAANAAGSEERLRALLEGGNTSQAVYDAAKQARQSAGANVAQARAALAKAQEQAGYARLYSDFDGVVTGVFAEVGETVAAGQTVVSVARPDVREAVVDIPVEIASGLAAGDAFEVTLLSLPSIRTGATVREIAPQADSPTRTLRVRLAMSDPPDAFRLGATINAVPVRPASATIALPDSALLERDGKSLVWVVDAGTSTVAAREIEIGRRMEGSFAVASGLEPGDRVVTAGVHSLEEGQKVRIDEGAPE